MESRYCRISESQNELREVFQEYTQNSMLDGKACEIYSSIGAFDVKT